MVHRVFLNPFLPLVNLTMRFKLRTNHYFLPLLSSFTLWLKCKLRSCNVPLFLLSEKIRKHFEEQL